MGYLRGGGGCGLSERGGVSERGEGGCGLSERGGRLWVI